MSEGAAAPLLTRDFRAILISQAAFGYSASAFSMLPKFLTAELSASASQIGGLAVAFGVASVVATPLMGELVDRLGRRRLVTLGALLMAATSLGFVAVDALGPLVYGLRALQGVAFVMAFVGGSTLAVEEAPPERLAQALGLFGSTMLSMNAVGPVVTEELAGRIGWRWAFATAAAGAAACCLLVRRVRERPREAKDRPVPGIGSIARRPRQLRMIAIVSLTGAACGVVFTFHQPFAMQLGMTRVGSFFAAYALLAIAVRAGLGHLIDRVGRHLVAGSCLALYAAVVAAMTQLGRLGLVPLGAGFGIAHGLFFPAFNAIAVEGVGELERGKLMAIFIGAFNLGFAIGAFGLGFLADSRGYPAIFEVAAGGALLGLGVLLASPEGRGRRSGSSP